MNCLVMLMVSWSNWWLVNVWIDFTHPVLLVFLHLVLTELCFNQVELHAIGTELWCWLHKHNTIHVLLDFCQWFWATRECLLEGEISKICLFSRPTGQGISWKTNFENCYINCCINFYQYNTAWATITFVSGTCFCCLLIPLKVTPHHVWVSCLITWFTTNAIE